MSYDFTAAEEFLRDEVGMSARELYDEIEDAITLLATLRGKRKNKSGIFRTLDLCSDLAERLIPEHSPILSLISTED